MKNQHFWDYTVNHARTEQFATTVNKFQAGFPVLRGCAVFFDKPHKWSSSSSAAAAVVVVDILNCCVGSAHLIKQCLFLPFNVASFSP